MFSDEIKSKIDGNSTRRTPRLLPPGKLFQIHFVYSIFNIAKIWQCLHLYTFLVYIPK